MSTKAAPACNGQPRRDNATAAATANGQLPAKSAPASNHNHDLDSVPLLVLLTTYFSYAILIVVGHFRDFFGKIFHPQDYVHLTEQNGYAPITSDFESLFTRRMYYRVRDCFSRPVTGVPGRTIAVLERYSEDYNKTFKLTGEHKQVLNLSSYNYLGFAQSEGYCADYVEREMHELGISPASPRLEVGTLALHQEAEALAAEFLGVEDAVILSMGYATNSTTIPAFVSKGCLLISDELNHASLVAGSRLSGATIRVFKHNDVEDLENLLRECISQGQPRTHRPWKKIMVVVEGLYSMEGDICILPEIVALKEQYKFYLYVDEAHSIGALGPRGRGVCDFYGIDPRKVDILMGTFTKSFGAAGGYISGKKEIMDYMRIHCHSQVYAEPVPVPVLSQIISSMSLIMGRDGTDMGAKKLAQIADNAAYFSRRLREMGFIVLGNPASPVVPLLLFNPGKIGAFSRECLKRGIAVVVVSYPATPIILGRVRFCLSSAHTREDLDFALDIINQVGDTLLLKQAS